MCGSRRGVDCRGHAPRIAGKSTNASAVAAAAGRTRQRDRLAESRRPSGLLLHRRPITRAGSAHPSLRHRGPRRRLCQHHRPRSTRINLCRRSSQSWRPTSDSRASRPPGKDGCDGKDSQNGTTPKVDQDAIVAAVLAKIDLDEIASRVPPSPRSPIVKFITWLWAMNRSRAGIARAAVRQASAKFRGVTTADPPANYTGQFPWS